MLFFARLLIEGRGGGPDSSISPYIFFGSQSLLTVEASWRIDTGSVNIRSVFVIRSFLSLLHPSFSIFWFISSGAAWARVCVSAILCCYMGHDERRRPTFEQGCQINTFVCSTFPFVSVVKSLGKRWHKGKKRRNLAIVNQFDRHCKAPMTNLRWRMRLRSTPIKAPLSCICKVQK